MLATVLEDGGENLILRRELNGISSEEEVKSKLEHNEGHQKTTTTDKGSINDEIELKSTMQRRPVLDRLLCRSKNRRTNSDRKNTKSRKNIFEFGLLKDIPFLFFCITLCLFTMAFQLGQVFITAMARERGVSKQDSALCLSIMGVADTLGRIGSGILFDRPKIKPYRTYTYNLFLFLIAVTCCMFPIMAHSFLSFGVISGFFGLFTGTYIAQKSVIIVDLLGVEKLVSSFGMIICFQGIGSLIGPLLSGILWDKFGRYDESFYFGAAVSFASGVVFLVGNIYSYRRKKRDRMNTQPTDSSLTQR